MEPALVSCPGKNKWPELVGANGHKAAMKIQRENPHVRATVLPEGSIVTRDYRCDRVWVWVNPHGIVIRPPTVG